MPSNILSAKGEQEGKGLPIRYDVEINQYYEQCMTLEDTRLLEKAGKNQS